MRATNPLGRSARGGTNLPNSASPQHNRKPFYTAQLEVVQPPNSANPPLLHADADCRERPTHSGNSHQRRRCPALEPSWAAVGTVKRQTTHRHDGAG